MYQLYRDKQKNKKKHTNQKTIATAQNIQLLIATITVYCFIQRVYSGVVGKGQKNTLFS